jgi:hypothetical protein
MGKENISDCFIDFFDKPLMTFNLIQELFSLSIKIFKEQINGMIHKILEFLQIQNNPNNVKYIENVTKPIFQEYFTQIFESESKSSEFYSIIKLKFEDYMYNDIKTFEKENEFEDMVESRSFKNIITNIKKMLLFIHFHDPPLKFEIDEHKIRKSDVKVLKTADCLCVEGFIKDNKSCLILVSPPLLKNGYAYQGLKPIVIAYNSNSEEIMLQPSKGKEDEGIINTILPGNNLNIDNGISNMIGKQGECVSSVNASASLSEQSSPSIEGKKLKGMSSSHKHFNIIKQKSSSEKVFK